MKFIKSILIISIYIFTINAHGFNSQAKYAVLLDFDTNKFLFEKNADEQITPSSLTKLMTLYILFDHLKNNIFTLEDKFKVSKKAWRMGGSKTFVDLASYVDIESLINGIVVQSGNDASIVVAEGISGSEENFANLMNETAKKLGMNNSNFVNATGWPDKNHYMSVRDVAILAKRLIADFPQYYHYFKKTTYSYNDIKQSNRNTMIGTVPGVDGLKTGHTEKGGYAIATSAIRKERRLISVVNGLDSAAERVDASEKLLDYGFYYFKNEKFFSKNQVIDNVDIWLGNEKTLPIIIDQDINIIYPKLVKKDIKVNIDYQSPIKAPVKKGSQIANLTINIPGEEELNYPLYAGKNIKKQNIFSQLSSKFNYLIFGQ